MNEYEDTELPITGVTATSTSRPIVNQVDPSNDEGPSNIDLPIEQHLDNNTLETPKRAKKRRSPYTGKGKRKLQFSPSPKRSRFMNIIDTPRKVRRRWNSAELEVMKK